MNSGRRVTIVSGHYIPIVPPTFTESARFALPLAHHPCNSPQSSFT